MKLSPDEVKKVAGLARIGLTPAEVTKYRAQLSEVVDYNAAELAKIKRSIEPELAPSTELGQEDQPRPSLAAQDALANAPDSRDGFFIVPKVLDQ